MKKLIYNKIINENSDKNFETEIWEHIFEFNLLIQWTLRSQIKLYKYCFS